MATVSDKDIGQEIELFASRVSALIEAGAGGVFLFLTLLYLGFVAAKAPTVTPLTFAVVIAFFLVLALAAHGLYLLWLNQNIVIYEYGFGIRNRRGEKRWLWSSITEWRAVSSLFSSSKNGVDSALFVDSFQVLRLDSDYMRHSELFSEVQTTLQELMFPDFQAAYDRGEMIRAGGFAVKETGISVAGETIPWNNLRSIHFTSTPGDLIVEQHTPRREIHFSIYNAPNAMLVVPFAMKLLSEKVIAALDTADNHPAKPEPVDTPPIEVEGRINIQQQTWLALSGIVFALLCGMMIIPSSSDRVDSMTGESVRSVTPSTTIVMTLGAVAGAALTLYALRLVLLYPRLVASVNGLTFSTRLRRKSWRWEDFDRYVMVRMWNLGSTCALYADNHEVYRIPGYLSNIGDLQGSVMNMITRQQLPDYQARFERGETLDFGKVSLNQQGISSGGQMAAWDIVTAFDLVNTGAFNRALTIYGDKQRILIQQSIFALPNIQTLLNLIQKKLEQSKPKNEPNVL